MKVFFVKCSNLDFVFIIVNVKFYCGLDILGCLALEQANEFIYNIFITIKVQ